MTIRTQALLHACLAPGNILGINGTLPHMPDAMSSELFRCCVSSLGYKCVTRCYQTVTNPCVYFEIKRTK